MTRRAMEWDVPVAPVRITDVDERLLAGPGRTGLLQVLIDHDTPRISRCPRCGSTVTTSRRDCPSRVIAKALLERAPLPAWLAHLTGQVPGGSGPGDRADPRRPPPGRGRAAGPVPMLRPDQLRFHPRNVRRTYTGLEPLAASIKTQGVLLPLLAHRRWVTPTGQPEIVELLAGHRRVLAAEMAGLQRVPVILRPRVSDDEALLGFLAEDQKESLTAAERRDAIVALHHEFCYDLAEVAHQLGYDVATVRALYEGRDVAPARSTGATAPAVRTSRLRRATPRIRPTAVHELVAAWDGERLTGAEVIGELRAMLGDWTPSSRDAGASAGSTEPGGGEGDVR